MVGEGAARILRAEDPEVAELCSSEWEITARSFGAVLHAKDIRPSELMGFLLGVQPIEIRELLASDSPAILELDHLTESDYPGGVATAHTPLDTETSVATLEHPGFGAFAEDGRLIGMTFVDVETAHGSAVADTDFTVVVPEYRGRHIATALKAASLLTLTERGIQVFRTGGSADNTAILSADARLGYTIDEHWVTLERPA